MTNRIAFAVLCSAVLVACSNGPTGSGGSRPSGGGQGGVFAQSDDQPRRRALAATGEPGVVAAADVGFARSAREDGQWIAYAGYAASGAVVHTLTGPVDAAPWIAAQANVRPAMGWTPTAVWTSCDGSLAVSFGRFAEAAGVVGSYATVWALQGDGRYKWTYTMRGPDNPQPPPPPPRLAPDPDVIVVPALGLIDGRVADCLRGAAAPPAPAATPPASASRDGTLQVRWDHAADGTRRLVVDYLREGRWQSALDFVMPPEGATR